ncbi:hypothetical protein ACFLVV_02010 [Chloroflexota bacterium]
MRVKIIILSFKLPELPFRHRLIINIDYPGSSDIDVTVYGRFTRPDFEVLEE